MAARTKRSRVQDFQLQFLFGGKVASEALVRRGMADLERELTKQFRSERALEVERTTYLKKVHGPLLDVISRDERVASGIRGLREIDTRLGKQKLVAPKIPKDKQRIFTGSIGTTITPPYNYPWTWSAKAGSPSLEVAVNNKTGQMSFFISSNLDNYSSGSARAAVGIYFRPITANGILRFSVNPAFNHHSWADSQFASAHSDAFIGLYVGRYNLSGGFDGAPVNQKISLWNDNPWWGSDDRNGSNSGYPLFAQFNVDNSHWYALWVWCGGNATADGFGIFCGSGAGSGLNVTVPSMTWELF